MPDATFTLRSPMPAPADELYAWHARPGAFRRLQPPWEAVEVTDARGGFDQEKYTLTLRTKVLGPFKGTWVAEAFGFQPGRQFEDRQLKGPFAAWHHTHRTIPDGPDRSVLEDHVEYRLPLGAAGRLFGAGTVRRRLAAMFAYRHALTASDLRRHAPHRGKPRMTVAVTGSRGLVGSELVEFLTTGGHRVVRLVTGKGGPPYDDGTTWVNWDPTAPLPPGTLDGVGAVVHLAGENVAEGRWGDAKKRKILDSRAVPTRHFAEAAAAARPGVFVSASAVGFYGDRGDEVLTEDAPPGTGFFPEVGRAWEDATGPTRDAGVRTVNLRFGAVLTPRGGALGKQLFAFKAGGGAVLGSGKQWVPWVTIGDAVGAIHHALTADAVAGPVNVCAPHPVTNREFTKILGRVLRRPAFLWLPGAALRVMFGELADAALLVSTRAVPGKLLDTGFAFDHGELEPALRFVLGR